MEPILWSTRISQTTVWQQGIPECWESIMKLGGNYENTIEQFSKNKKKFENMGDFLKNI
ncbi:hypothetical protein AALH30_01640 [Blautia pseudococcoides]|uniref:hypothetical protein n=1 Tax=Blautia pseudococcoides TaxID=1796616 RepID=UPI00148B07F4|nr:hypothetical protein [Blautia pseudococcoides]